MCAEHFNGFGECFSYCLPQCSVIIRTDRELILAVSWENAFEVWYEDEIGFKSRISMQEHRSQEDGILNCTCLESALCLNTVIVTNTWPRLQVLSSPSTDWPEQQNRFKSWAWSGKYRITLEAFAVLTTACWTIHLLEPC